MQPAYFIFLHPLFSPLILVCLLAILAASTGMFVVLVRRWTSRRQWVSLADWARQADFQIGKKARLPTEFPYDVLKINPAARRAEFSKDRDVLLQLDVPTHAANQPALPAAHLLVRRVEADWPATGFRPVAAAESVLDRAGLAPFPLMGAGQRFLVIGSDSSAARLLAQSSIRALLPQDVALLLHGRHLMLDFSLRPFDGLEFTRMLALAEQLVAHLPPLTPARQE